jgi:hypothetical protein
LYTRPIWMTMDGLLCDVTLNPTWRHIQNGGLAILNTLLQYGYLMNGLVMNNSKTEAFFFLKRFFKSLFLKSSFTFNLLDCKVYNVFNQKVQ